MEPTRRFWTAVALAVAGAALAPLLSNPLLLGIPIGVGTWILAHELQFMRSIRRIQSADPAVVTQSVMNTGVHDGTNPSLRVQFSDTVNETAKLDASIDVTVPSTLLTDTVTPRHVPDNGTVNFDVSLQLPVAGSFEIPTPELHITSAHGLFDETIQAGNACSFIVDPASLRGGTRRQDDALDSMSSFAPGNVREYAPGDPMNRIDWKATARLGELHVREPDPESIRETHLFVDQREPMREGPPGRTKLDYAREIGLAITGQAANNEDPLQVSFVDHGQVFDSQSVTAGEAAYEHVRRRLYDLASDSYDQSSTTDFRTGKPLRFGRNAAHKAGTLADDDDVYSRTLAPYFETMTAYSAELTSEELLKSVRASLHARDGDPWFVIVTDDSNRQEVRVTTELVADYGIELTVFVLPTIRFVDGNAPKPIDEDTTSREFQAFLDTLNAIPGITAFEAGPGKPLPDNPSQPRRSVAQ